MEILTGQSILQGARIEDIFPEQWQRECAIIIDYMPLFPRPDWKPRLVVRYTRNDAAEYNAHAKNVAKMQAEASHGPSAGYGYGSHEASTYLRYSRGPGLGVFWDTYGDDFQNVGLAIRAIMSAQCPRIHYVPDSRIGL